MKSKTNPIRNDPPLPELDLLDEWRSFKPGLDRIAAALQAMGSPHRQYPHVVVGGTNGKGTVSLNVARSASQPCGLFVSPHVLDVRERITVAGAPFPDSAWRRAYRAILEKIGALSLSYFEWMLALAVWMFREARVRFAVFEVGLGGRLDAVNALDPMLSVLTNVSVDHAEILGATVEQIALEKIEIARANRPFVCPASVYAMPAARARLTRIGCETRVFDDEPGFEGNKRTVRAVHEALGWPPFAGALDRLPGRRARLELGAGVWVDGAHNPASWQDLADWLVAEGQTPIRILASLAEGRDPSAFLEIMKPIAAEIYVWRAGFSRELPLERWPRRVPVWKDSHVDGLLDKPLLVCGSLYAVGRFLQIYSAKA